jgi:hypothetical protein
MAAPDQGLRPETTSDHFMAAAVEELRAVVKILNEIKDVMISSTQPKTPDLRSFEETRVKEPVINRKR